MVYEEAMMKTLEQNMNYRDGEEVAVICQEWDEHLGDDTRTKFEKCGEVAERLAETFENNGVDVELFRYVPDEPRNGVDAPDELYEEIGSPDVIFMPTAYSLTHTGFREEQTDKGARVASMPGFTLELFEEGGPMSVDYDNIRMMTDSVAQRLRENRYVHVTGEGTDIWVEINNDIVITSDGVITEPGEYGNLPGAEAFVVPVHEGDTNGHFTVPAGWGGTEPLEYKAKFVVKDGRFVDIMGETEEGQEYIDEEVKPVVFGEDDYDVLAELGIGTNPAVDEEYIEEHGWSLLVSEKVFGSAHFANGNSAAMGGENDVPVHVDWVVPDVEIEYFREKSRK